eukprot:COSAG02_NODE_6293_length_3672_cov_2.687086_2_plen_138_part_00
MGESHGFLPDTFFYRLVAALVQDVQTVGNAFKHLYNDRVVIVGKQRFMVTHDRAQHCLLVTVFDDGAGSPAAVCARLDQLLPTLLTSFGLQYRFEVQCTLVRSKRLKKIAKRRCSLLCTLKGRRNLELWAVARHSSF